MIDPQQDADYFNINIAVEPLEPEDNSFDGAELIGGMFTSQAKKQRNFIEVKFKKSNTHVLILEKQSSCSPTTDKNGIESPTIIPQDQQKLSWFNPLIKND